MDTERKIEPRKSMRHNFEKCDCLLLACCGEMSSFQITNIRARIVGGHCPKNDLKDRLVRTVYAKGYARVCYHRHPTVSVKKPPIGPPKDLPVVAAILT